MGTQPPSPKWGGDPQFSVHVYCGQTAALMKTPLGTEVDLGSAHIVLDGDAAPPRKGHISPLPSFRPMSIVATVAHLSYCRTLVTICKSNMQMRYRVVFLMHQTYRITWHFGVIFVNDVLEKNLQFHQIVVYVEVVIHVEIWTQFLLETL